MGPRTCILEVEVDAWPPPRGLWIEVAVVLLVTTVPLVLYSVWCHWLPAPQALPFAYLYSASLIGSVALAALGLHFIVRSGQPLEEFGIVRPSLWDIPGGLVVLGVYWSIYSLVFGPFLTHLFPDSSTHDERISLLLSLIHI